MSTPSLDADRSIERDEPNWGRDEEARSFSGELRGAVHAAAPERAGAYTAASPAGEAVALRSMDALAILGHELRNPVGAIGIGIELLKSGALQRERRQHTLEMMQRQVTHVARLLDDLFNGACLTDSKLEIERERVDLAQVAVDALDTIGRLVEDGGHELSAVLPRVGTVWVRGDHDRLNEVVVNLLSNAVKYTPSGGRIALEISADDATAMIIVRDTGIGIAADFMPRVFDLSARERRTLDGPDSGLGVGLALVRNFVQLHGGDVSVYSAGEGEGSEFEVRLPRIRTGRSHTCVSVQTGWMSRS